MRHRKNYLAVSAVVCSLLITSCGGNDEPAEETPSATPTADSKVHATYAADLQIPEASVPEQWQGGSGWVEHGVQKVVALPDYVAYLVEREVPEGEVVDGEAEDLRLVTSLDFYDAKGELVSRSEEPDEIDVDEAYMFASYKDSEIYLTLIEQGYTKVDKTSTKEPVPTVVVTGFDSAGKQKFRFDTEIGSSGVVTYEHGVVFLNQGHDNIRSIIDVETGELTDVPELSGATWFMRVDGVDLFVEGNTEINSDQVPEGALTNGEWRIESIEGDGGAPSYWSGGSLGRYVNVYRTPVKPNDKGEQKPSKCLILDPHTGKTVDGSDELNGLCRNDINYESPRFLQPDNTLIFQYKDLSENTGNAVLFPDESDAYVVPENVSFTPVSYSPEGTIFGTTEAHQEEQAAALDVSAEEEPKVLPEVNRIPLVVSGNGIAVFSYGDIADGQTESVFFKVLPEKKEAEPKK